MHPFASFARRPAEEFAVPTESFRDLSIEAQHLPQPGPSTASSTAPARSVSSGPLETTPAEPATGGTQASRSPLVPSDFEVFPDPLERGLARSPSTGRSNLERGSVGGDGTSASTAPPGPSTDGDSTMGGTERTATASEKENGKSNASRI